MSGPAQIALQGVRKEFAGRGEVVAALQPIDLEVQSEQFVALVGPSGCG
jgi:NitT/TauT family transport system ATP-binding protein